MKKLNCRRVTKLVAFLSVRHAIYDLKNNVMLTVIIRTIIQTISTALINYSGDDGHDDVMTHYTFLCQTDRFCNRPTCRVE